jgi:arginyl-tRNA synthetase
MPVPSLSSLLAERVSTHVAAVAPELTFDPQVRRSAHADFQADGALAAGRAVGRNPRALAATVADGLLADPVLAASSVAGPGFINLTLTDETLLTQAAARLGDARLGVPRPDTGRVTVIDYSQPNIAKEMHVGHLRSTIIGDALARILTHLGGTVVRQNHIGDWGTQFGMLIEHLFSDTAGAGPAGISGLSALYRAARARFEADPAFVERSRRRVVALQAGDPETVAAWRDIVAESTRYFTDVYDRLGVLLEPGDVAGESFYNPMLAGVTEDLLALGVATVSDGAVCVFFDDVRGPDGAPVPLIVRKRDGGFGYAATDLAAVRYRVTDLHADRVLYVVDARQALHFRMVFDTARRAGWVPPEVAVEHVQFGLMLGPGGRPFKTRYGGNALFTDLIDEAVAGAREVAARNPSLVGAVLDERARQVGIGALKYADLATSRTRDYVYDPARMLSLTGNTSVYLQYLHVRARSVLRKAGTAGAVDTGLPLEPAERMLILDLDGFADAVVEVGATLEPHRLCGYLFRLAQSATAFWERCPVLTAPDRVRANRLALWRLTAETMRAGLDLLGIESPDRL